MKREGKPVAEKLEAEVKTRMTQQSSGKYIAILMFGKEHPGQAYVRSKEAFGERVGMGVRVAGNDRDDRTADQVKELIKQYNIDPQCVGIILQLPLPASLQANAQGLLDSVVWSKDIDGLSTPLQTIAQTYPELFVPATPRAVMAMIDHYAYELPSKHVAMLGQSSLIGIPLTALLKTRGAQVQPFTVESDQTQMKTFCHDTADLIISATGQLGLVTPEFARPGGNQVVVDVGRGYKDGKPAGDVQRELIEPQVAAVSPVPGGVGPVTVSALFANIISLHEHKVRISSLV